VDESKPLFTGHAEEGYALDWSPTVEGRMVTAGAYTRPLSDST